MGIHEWIKNYRIQKGLTLEDVSFRAQVETSALSRFEKGYSDSSLLYIMKLFDGFGILNNPQYLNDAFCEAWKIKLPKTAKESNSGTNITNDDVIKFVVNFYRTPSKGISVLKELLNWVYHIQLDEIRDKQDWPFDLQTVPELFTNEDVIKLFYPLQFHVSSVRYPNTIPNGYPYYYYENGAAVSYVDTGAYLHQTRLEKAVDTKTLASKADISQPMINRIENGDLVLLKAQEPANLDKTLALDGRFFALCWSSTYLHYSAMKAVEENFEKGKDDSKLKLSEISNLISMLFKIERWVEYKHPLTNLDDIRTLLIG